MYYERSPQSVTDLQPIYLPHFGIHFLFPLENPKAVVENITPDIVVKICTGHLRKVVIIYRGTMMWVI